MNTKLALFFFIAFLCLFSYLSVGCPTLSYTPPSASVEFDPMAQQDRLNRVRDERERVSKGL